jgi:hypothetical protein
VRVLNWIGLMFLRLFRVPPPAHGADTPLKSWS